MPLGRLLTGAAGLPRTAFRVVSGVAEPRKVHQVPGRTHIPVRGVHQPGTEAMAAALKEELRTIAGVLRAEVNGPLGLVMVFHDEDTPLGLLIDVVEAIEKRHDATNEPFAGIAHPPDGQALVREAALVGGYLIAGGGAVLGALLRGSRLPPGIATLASMVDSSPQFRARLERKVGRTATDWMIGSGVSLTHALAFQPTGPLINSAHRLVRLAEMRGHLQTWNERSTHLDAGDGAFEAPALYVPERPVPLPDGAVERAAWTIPAAVTAAVGTYAATRDIDRAQGVLAAGVPKAARLGREAFAAQIGIAASIRDIIIFQPEALRRLDRVDRIIVDVSALRTGGLVIDEVLPLTDGIAPEQAYERAYALADLDEPTERRKDGPWAIAPYKNGRAEAQAMRERGATVLQLTRNRKLVALVSVVPELDPLAEVTLDVARKAAKVLVAGASAEVRQRVTVDGTVAGGSRLLTSVRDLQQEGHVVMLIAVRGGAALAAADVGVGILGPAGHPPWGAHVLCGPGLGEACMLLSALVPAREASKRAARIAIVGSAAGGLLAATGTPERSARRARLAVDTAAVSAFVVGTWAGLSAGRKPAPLPTDRTPWHAWPVQAVLDRLDSSTEGIGEDEAAERRTQEPAEEAPGLLKVTLEELDNPLTPALAAGAGVSAVVGSIMDAALIGSVLGANALMSGVQRVSANRALKQLVDLSAVRVKLRRPGDETKVTADELVVGDVVMLIAGDVVPADCRLLSAQGLEVDESGLTGESQLVEKSPRASLAGTVADRTSMLYEGSVVAAGEAVGVVVATGPRTEMGRTVRLGENRRATSGVEQRLRSLTKVTLPIALGAGGVLFLSDLMRGRPVADALGPAVSLAVAAVPEGLPFVATAAELATARRMSRRGAIVRNPTTIEALGRIDVLCFDKTGTLTMGKLRVRQVSDGDATMPVESLSLVGRKIVAAALRASPESNGGGRLPHPTDQAIMRAVNDLDMDVSEGLGTWVRVDQLPFEPARGYHAVLGKSDDGQRLSVKGAPEIILDQCVTWERDDGIVPFDETAREKVDQEVDRLARLGNRVLAVAERPASGRRDLTESRIGNLCLLGLVAIADPVRPTAADAVARLRKAGVDIVMITGDHPTTAEAIGAELNLLNGGEIMTGAELDALDDDALAESLVGISIFARVSPTQKARVVQALRTAGRVVAVTGDGANDAPAIRLADVGIALGEYATPAARETADVVITDERIETITDAIADCRAMWRSTRDALAVLLGGNLGEIAFTLGTGLISGRSPLNVRQLLLVNLLTDMLPAIALAARPPSGISHEELLSEGPEQSLGAALTRDIVIRGTATAGAGMVAWLLARVTGTRSQADTVGLVALVGTQLAQTIAAGGRDPVVLGAGFASFAALAAIVQVPGLSHFFGSRPLLPHGWAIGLGCAMLFAVAALLATRLMGIPEIASSQVLEGPAT